MELEQHQYKLAFQYLGGSSREEEGTLSRRKHSGRASSNMQNMGNSIKVLYCENG